MTDNEIIKALECCEVGKDKCRKCPFYCTVPACSRYLAQFALDLINRKDAEIEKLNVELVGMRGACESYRIHYDVAQAEIKRLNGISDRLNDICTNQDLDIERLKEEIRILQYCNKINISSSAELHDRLRTAKSEAIKELAKRAENISVHGKIDIDDFFDLVKEMTEGSENVC